MEIYYEHEFINIREEDIEYYRNLKEEILSTGRHSTFTFWNIILTIILSFFYVIPGVIYFIYLLTPMHAKGMAEAKANEGFYLEKIGRIPLYTSTEGLTIVENLGSINVKGKFKARVLAYNKGANAIINVSNQVVSHSNTKSDIIGKGVHTNVSTSHYTAGDLAIIKLSSSNTALNNECMEKSGFNFQGWGKSSIQEFGYLIRMISNSKYDTIDEKNIKDIALDSLLLIEEIDKEISKPIPREQEMLQISNETAVANLVNLKNIIISIKKYTDCINKKS